MEENKYNGEELDSANESSVPSPEENTADMGESDIFTPEEKNAGMGESDIFTPEEKTADIGESDISTPNEENNTANEEASAKDSSGGDNSEKENDESQSDEALGDNNSYEWHSNSDGDGGYTHAFNWSYEDMHEPIRFDNEIKKDKKKSSKKFGIIIGIVFAVAMVILAAAIWSDLRLATKDDLKGEVNININVSNSPSAPSSDAVDPDALEKFKDTTVVVSCDASIGTGIIFTQDGYIVTNYHVVEDATSIQVSLYNGSSYRATLVGYISSNDIAVLKINANNLTPATFAKLENCYVSQRVYAVGTPAGATFAWSVSSGIISATNREAKFYDENNLIERKMTVIQTDTPVNPGNSGGPLINSNCEVVGIITMKLANDYVGMGFAIPSDTAIELITKIFSGEGDDMEESSVTKPAPQMGIVGFDAIKGGYYTTNNAGNVMGVKKEFAEQYPDSCFFAHASGIYILKLTPGLDAETKLKVGDIIVDIEGSGMKTMAYLRTALDGKKVGDKISITVSRNGEIFDTEIELK